MIPTEASRILTIDVIINIFADKSQWYETR